MFNTQSVIAILVSQFFNVHMCCGNTILLSAHLDTIYGNMVHVAAHIH